MEAEMKPDFVKGADAIGMFCRLHMNTKRDLPIRPSEMGVLIYIQKQSESVTPLMISQFFNIAKPSVSAMVKALIKNGYLTQSPSETDKRSYTINISDKGKMLVETTFVEYFKSVELLKEKMGEAKFNQFIELVETANKILEEV